MTDIPETKTTDVTLTTPKSLEPVYETLPTVMTRVVIVGAGFGGLWAAKALGDEPVHVTVIDRTNHHLFQPLLYQVATAVLSPNDISVPIREVLRKQPNTEVLMAEVTGVDVQGQRVLMHEKYVPYDYLILATGAHENYFGHNEWQQFSSGLKSIAQALTLRYHMLRAFEDAELEPDPEKREALLTFALVGAGPTGVEMAGAIAELARQSLATEFRHINPKSARVLLIEALPRILPTFPESLAKKAQKTLTRLGVEVRTSTPVEAIDETGVVIGGKHLAAKTVIWTAGVAASPAGKWLGAETDRAGRVKVNSDLSVPGHPNIFVIGDTASATQEDGSPVPGVAPAAMQEGDYVASVITDRAAGKEHEQAFQYVNKGNMATIGRLSGIVDVGGKQYSGFVGWILWLLVHIYYLIGFRNRVVVIFQWVVSYLLFQRTARIISFDDKSRIE
jgi:NADH:ubiquinone reductase (H+-translocating)